MKINEDIYRLVEFMIHNENEPLSRTDMKKFIRERDYQFVIRRMVESNILVKENKRYKLSDNEKIQCVILEKMLEGTKAHKEFMTYNHNLIRKFKEDKMKVLE